MWLLINDIVPIFMSVQAEIKTKTNYFFKKKKRGIKRGKLSAGCGDDCIRIVSLIMCNLNISCRTV